MPLSVYLLLIKSIAAFLVFPSMSIDLIYLRLYKVLSISSGADVVGAVSNEIKPATRLGNSYEKAIAVLPPTLCPIKVTLSSSLLSKNFNRSLAISS